MNPIYKSGSFWTMVAAVIGQLLVGYGFKLEAAMLITSTATIVAYLAQRGWVERAYISAMGEYNAGFDDGTKAAAKTAAAKTAK